MSGRWRLPRRRTRQRAAAYSVPPPQSEMRREIETALWAAFNIPPNLPCLMLLHVNMVRRGIGIETVVEALSTLRGVCHPRNKKCVGSEVLVAMALTLLDLDSLIEVTGLARERDIPREIFVEMLATTPDYDSSAKSIFLHADQLPIYE